MSASCEPHRNRLAEGPVCTVDECACGVLHVTIGAITIRLQTDVVESIWLTLGEAIQRLAARRRASSLPDEMVLVRPEQRPS